MATRNELQGILKEKYGINKNISQALDKEECEQLIFLLEREPSAVKLVESFAEKNVSLGQNNAYLGRMRSRAEKQLESLKGENEELTKANDELKKENKSLKNLVDQIKLVTVIDMKKILKLEDSEIRQALMKWLKKFE